MDYLFGELERMIEEIESMEDFDRDDVIELLKKYKEEFEEIQMKEEEEKGLQWEDLD
jgi:hypothetical protein